MAANDFFIAGIGASAGGMEALFELFSNADPLLPVAWVVVRHLKRDIPTRFAQLVRKHTAMDAMIIRGGERPEPGNIYIMPENRKLIIRDAALYLRSRPSGEIINNAIDTFFLELASDARDKAIGIILSGTGKDGIKGEKAIEDNGGLVLVQDPSSALYSQLPANAINLDHPDHILPPAAMPAVIAEHVRRRLSAPSS
jgi:two-component system, chemotaxis family, protein-glutamate methylesterase/glutaminase